MISERGKALTIWIIVFTVLTFTTLLLRLWAARVQKRDVRLDDYFVIGAFISLLALLGTTFWAIANGLGAHTDTVSVAQQTVQKKLLLSSGITWTLATILCKLAILWLYTQIFTTRKFKLAAYTLMGVTVSYAFIFIPIFFTQCKPVHAAWDPVLSLTSCRPITRQEFASVAINMALDLAVVILPLPVVWSLHMPTRKKIAVSLMFSLGLVIVAIMTWRIHSTVRATKEMDWNYGLYITALQSLLELWLGIIAANLPTLAPLSSQLVMPKIMSYFHPGNSKEPSSGRRLVYGMRGGEDSALKREKFKMLGNEDPRVQLNETRHLNKIEAGASSRSISMDDHSWVDVEANGIGMRRDVDVSFETFHEPPKKTHIFGR
ncbi:hypothetical protein GJ744_000314 [Endocarpon pusillum]|uniref:Rhodopsin domain-containing protein n=1 Tax=Endocarpon pusillum TaxID=364733 RepID=A0A8H7AR70_9EURO|nr:hypothetical protein GJ744_000314 [Endocarpon pusillum]